MYFVDFEENIAKKDPGSKILCENRKKNVFELAKIAISR
jgi:hypothetical protein